MDNPHLINPGRIINGYCFHEIIGRGRYAYVYRVTSLRFSRDFAAKVIVNNPAKTGRIDRESQIIQTLDHRGIIRLYDVFSAHNYLIMIEDLCKQGSLENYIRQFGPLSIDRFRQIAHEIIEALIFIHQLDISHRDIKPSNILLDAQGHIKITDFGIAQKVRCGQCYIHTGSMAYLAPEVADKAIYDPFLADVWSLGMTFYYLLDGNLPWYSSLRGFVMISDIQYNTIRRSDIIPENLFEIISAMLNSNPESRPTLQWVQNAIKSQRPNLLAPIRRTHRTRSQPQLKHNPIPTVLTFRIPSNNLKMSSYSSIGNDLNKHLQFRKINKRPK